MADLIVRLSLACFSPVRGSFGLPRQRANPLESHEGER